MKNVSKVKILETKIYSNEHVKRDSHPGGGYAQIFAFKHGSGARAARPLAYVWAISRFSL
jgi:hypothetical protein